MNNDRISNTPGGERMLFGGIAFGLAFIAWQGLQHQLGDVGRVIVFALMAFGLVQLLRGVYAWKYTDRRAFAEEKLRENLLIDVPLINGSHDALNAIEDALVDLIAMSKRMDIEMQSIDHANEMGTIHLVGASADAIYSHVFATVARFAGSNGISLFPAPGQPLDTEIRGKRLLVNLPGRKVQ